MCVIVVLFGFFFFKQKTAYEMRISDWSSDVCSSDLDRRRAGVRRARAGRRDLRQRPAKRQGDAQVLDRDITQRCAAHPRSAHRVVGRARGRRAHRVDAGPAAAGGARRSEEYTSEIKSSMRISYAVFGVQKTKT